ncbi:MAG TPA: AMP-binding protein [Candidatus Acidoferrum sp.]|jgi:acyl-CoA synthetase (AMP-forming)/AMP-acid ligase II|nr:AMP-binding protein [Candidatus Acidoferrum sp.]
MNIATAGYGTLLDALEAAPSGRLFVLEWHDEDDYLAVTFGDFRRRTRNQSSFLRQQGVRRGDRVVFVMPQGIALMTAFAGSMMLGALPTILAYPNVKVDPRKYSSGLRGMTANLKADYVVTDESLPEELNRELTVTGTSKLIRSPNSSESFGEVSPEDVTSHPHGLAFVQHSAGTTGLQKGVALSHAAVLRQLSHLVEALRVSTSDRLYSWLPLYHDMGLIACFMLPMVCHLSVIMQSPAEWVQRPDTMLKLIQDHKCTIAWLPNFTFQFVPRRTSAETRCRYDLSSLRALINCSEPVKTESMNEFYEAFAPQGLAREALQSSYAMAENVFAVTQSGPKGPLQIYADGRRFRNEHLIVEVPSGAQGVISFTSSGRLLPQNQIRILSENGEMLPCLRVGEILIKSDSLFDGYYNRPDLTAQVMAEGWYRTGDLGFFHGEELFVVGRKKDLLIVGGENIYPQDVEEIVSKHPAIHDGRAVAVGLFNPDLGTEEIALVAEVEREESLEKSVQTEREIRAMVLAQMGVAVRLLFLKPPRWIVKSTAGKPARSATREKLLREHPELQSRS